MDVSLVNPFIAATQRVFETMLGLKLRPGKPTARSAILHRRKHASVTITLRGGATGAVVLQFPKELVINLARLLDDSAETFHDGVDALAELANIITGNAKRRLSDNLIEVSVPYVSSELTPANLKEFTPWLAIPFESTIGTFEFTMSVDLSETSKGPENGNPREPAEASV